MCYTHLHDRPPYTPPQGLANSPSPSHFLPFMPLSIPPPPPPPPPGSWTTQTCVHWSLTKKSWGLRQWLCHYGIHWWRRGHQLQWAWWSLWTLYSSRRRRRKCPNRRYWWGRTRITASTRPKSPTKEDLNTPPPPGVDVLLVPRY